MTIMSEVLSSCQLPEPSDFAIEDGSVELGGKKRIIPITITKRLFFSYDILGVPKCGHAYLYF